MEAAIVGSRRSDLEYAQQLMRLGDLTSAADVLASLVRRDKADPKPHELLGQVAARSNDPIACEAHLLRAAALPGCSPSALFQLGVLQLQGGRAYAAITTFLRVLQLTGEQFEPLHELGVAYSGLGETLQALRMFERAEKRNADSAVLHYNLGRVLSSLGRYSPAIERFDRALELDPDMQIALRDRGLALADCGRLDEGLRSLDDALHRAPDSVETLLARASVLGSLGRTRERDEAYEQLASLGPDTQYDRGYWLNARMTSCHWEWWPHALPDVFRRIGEGERVTVPFYLLPLPSSAQAQLACARTFASDFSAGDAPPISRARRERQKIRVCYFSSDFHDHPASQLLAGVFEHHDRKRFEWHGYALSLPTPDHMTRRVAKAFDRFVNVADRSDAEVTAMARAAGIDIAVDLNGFTAGARTAIFAGRAAPVQVSYLGFPGTMGCDFIDYIIADERLIRVEDRADYAEKVVTLPGSYWPNDNTISIAPATSARSEHGLPDGAFVYACFNNNFKITPDLFDIWMRVLHRVPNSVLWLLSSSEAARQSLEEQAERRGIEPLRLVWAKRIGLAGHLERHRHADLFLDCFHWNAHTTCSDALWAGLPVLTLRGPTFASRVASSQLHAVGLPELITSTPEDYESEAIALATGKSDALSSLRRRLLDTRVESDLFDTAGKARDLETAYSLMVERLDAHMAPDHLRIASGA